MKKTKHLVVVFSVAALLLSTAGCSSGDVSGPASSSPAATSSSTPQAMSAMEPGQPHDPVDMDNWVASVTANLGPQSALAGIAAHVGPDSSSSLTTSDSVLEPGSYSFFFACRGDGDVTFSVENAGVEQVTLEGSCAGKLQGGDFSTTEVGTDFVITALRAPADVVLRITDQLPQSTPE
ncbi:hypothetical protein [Salinibacterium sp. PAMC 21357]|uniref:hypothetical protein n=1 Tax=Salinibacterium sp. PAMC 21357 TaxID=1112215 RepID=UPI001146C9E8|nr:hypothetical protein [Salinibacterium sp. PAMC 21357]